LEAVTGHIDDNGRISRRHARPGGAVPLSRTPGTAVRRTPDWAGTAASQRCALPEVLVETTILVAGIVRRGLCANVVCLVVKAIGVVVRSRVTSIRLVEMHVRRARRLIIVRKASTVILAGSGDAGTRHASPIVRTGRNARSVSG